MSVEPQVVGGDVTSSLSLREKWQIVCSTEDEWEELVTSLSTIKTPSVRKLYRALEVSFVCFHIFYISSPSLSLGVAASYPVSVP